MELNFHFKVSYHCEIRQQLVPATGIPQCNAVVNDRDLKCIMSCNGGVTKHVVNQETKLGTCRAPDRGICRQSFQFDWFALNMVPVL